MRRIRNKIYYNFIFGNFRINDNGDVEKDLLIYDLDLNGDISVEKIIIIDNIQSILFFEKKLFLLRFFFLFLQSVGVYVGDEVVVYMNYSQGIYWFGNKGLFKNRFRCGFIGDDFICFFEGIIVDCCILNSLLSYLY